MRRIVVLAEPGQPDVACHAGALDEMHATGVQQPQLLHRGEATLEHIESSIVLRAERAITGAIRVTLGARALQSRAV